MRQSGSVATASLPPENRWHLAAWSTACRFYRHLKPKFSGLVSLGSTALALFTDAGAVWDARLADGTTGTETRWGAGAEIKNRISLFGIGFTHALGIAQPAQELFTDADYDLYYRVRAVVPF